MTTRDIKIIICQHFTDERDKKRLTDPDKNRELVTHLGNALTYIESSIKDDLKRLDSGESIEDIIPRKKS